MNDDGLRALVAHWTLISALLMVGMGCGRPPSEEGPAGPAAVGDRDTHSFARTDEPG